MWELILLVIGVAISGVIAFGTAILTLYLRSVSKSVDDNTKRLNGIDQKLTKVTTVMVMLMPEKAKKLLQEQSPLKFEEDSDIAKAVEEYLNS